MPYLSLNGKFNEPFSTTLVIDFMKNEFLQLALTRAAKMLGKPGRLFLLLGQLGNKLIRTDLKAFDGSAAKEKFLTLGRLVKAYAKGEYRAIPWKSMLTIVAAILYFISPFDLISDFIPVIGLSDDLSVLLWTYNSIKSDINNFLDWEESDQFHRIIKI